jgi:hypothetical protein
MPEASGVRKILVNALNGVIRMAKEAMDSGTKNWPTGERSSWQLHNHRK